MTYEERRDRERVYGRKLDRTAAWLFIIVNLCALGYTVYRMTVRSNVQQQQVRAIQDEQQSWKVHWSGQCKCWRGR
jgi:hypothetical protein